MEMHLQLLGVIEAVHEGRPLESGPPQRRAVLAALAVDAGRLVAVGTLVERVWGEAAPPGARSALYSHLTRIKQVLTGKVSLIRRTGGYLLDLDPQAVDAHRLARLLERARQGTCTANQRLDLLTQAVALWRGEPLPGLTTAWAERMRSGWTAQRVEAVLAWAQEKMRAGDSAGLVVPLSELVAEYPLVEPLIAAHMQALHAAGRCAEALAVFAAARDRLAGELGADPGPQLRDLHMAILRDGGRPSLPAAAPWPQQLRAPIADFTGRVPVIGELVAALRSGQLAVIHGMGGVGKTELAVLTAAALRADFPDGQLMVCLRDCTPATALRRLGMRGDDEQGLQRDFCARLSGKRVLVIADDASGAAQVRPLIPPIGSALLITSRVRFTLPGMKAIDLPPLPERDSIKLLQRICPRIGAEHARAIVRSGGFLPLAIRVSGSVLANNPALSVADYAAALADSRLRLEHLRDPDDSTLDVSASLQLSYASLSDADQRLLRRLSVMAGDFTTGLAGEVAQAHDTAAGLHLLLRRNLIEYDQRGDRWRLHDLVRDVGHRHLTESGEHEAVMWRYARESLAVAEETTRLYAVGGQAAAAAAARFRAEREHLSHAWRWAAGRAGHLAEDRFVVAAASSFFGLLGFLCFDRRTEIAPAMRLALVSARRIRDGAGEAVILNRLGQVHLDFGDTAQAIVYFTQQLALVRGLGDRLGQARALNNLGLAKAALGEAEQAIALHQTQLDLVLAAGSLRGEAMARGNLGHAHLLLGQTRQALAELGSALVLARELGDPHGESAVLSGMGAAHLARREPQRAKILLQQALVIAGELGDRHGQSKIGCLMSRAMMQLGYPAQALFVAQQAHTQAQIIGCHETVSQAADLLAKVRDAAENTSGR